MSSIRMHLAVCAVILPMSLVNGLARADAPAPAPAGSALENAFQSPPPDCRPWVYWWWLNANVTETSITRDLEAMAAKGIGGFLLFDVTAYGHHIVPAPPRKLEFMSPQWRALVRHAIWRIGSPGWYSRSP